MKRGLRKFDPPVEVKLTKSVSLLVRSAGRDSHGATKATVEVWNGRVLHTDQFNLTNAKRRERFAQDLVEKVRGAKLQRVQRHLMELEVKIERALSSPEAAAAPPSVDVAALWEQARPLAADSDLLQRVAEAGAGLGLVGEAKLFKLGYLAATARLLQKLVNLIVKGPPSGGKSFFLECLIRMLPPSAYVNYSAVSPRYLAYCDDDLRHRIVVLYEAQGMEDEGTGAYIMRSLLSEGRLDLGTVDKGEAGGNEARRLTKEGPTALFTSTIRLALEAQLETRALSLTITDTPDQSKSVVKGQASAAAGSAPEPPDLAPFHALQEWLAAAGERRVIIPYAPQLAALVPCTTVRIRRDFPMLLSLISACALLHQAQRDRSTGGEIIATLADYEKVRELVGDAFAVSQGGLTHSQQQAIQAVKQLDHEGLTGVSVEEVARHLRIERSVAQRHLSGARRGGCLRNIENRRNFPAKYVLGEPLLEQNPQLPTREQVGSKLEPQAQIRL